MRGSRLACACLAATLATATLSASVVTPPPFEAMVAEAGEIFVGQVVVRSSHWIERAGKRLIVTDVTFRTSDVVKGSPGALRTLTFLGGIIGDTRQEVAGMPSFMVGDRDVLFVRGEPSFVPLVGLYHGLFRVVAGRNATGEYIANNARQPILTTASYYNPQRLGASENPMRLADFLDSVRRASGGR